MPLIFYPYYNNSLKISTNSFSDYPIKCLYCLYIFCKTFFWWSSLESTLFRFMDPCIDLKKWESSFIVPLLQNLSMNSLRAAANSISEFSDGNERVLRRCLLISSSFWGRLLISSVSWSRRYILIWQALICLFVSGLPSALSLGGWRNGRSFVLEDKDS